MHPVYFLVYYTFPYFLPFFHSPYGSKIKLILLRTGFYPTLFNVGFEVEKMAVGQIFSEYFGFPCQFSFRQLFNIH
jgi:hypothetical protein